MMGNGSTEPEFWPTFTPRLFPIAALGALIYLLVRAWELLT